MRQRSGRSRPHGHRHLRGCRCSRHPRRLTSRAGVALHRGPVVLEGAGFDTSLPMTTTSRSNLGTAKPKNARPKGSDQDTRRHDETTSGSVIQCNNQIPGEVLRVSGSGSTPHQTSDRVPGHKIARTLEIPLAENTLPSGVQHIEVEVASKKTAPSLAPSPNQSYPSSWNGQDGYGCTPQGRQAFTARTNTFTTPPTRCHPVARRRTASATCLSGPPAHQLQTSHEPRPHRFCGRDARRSRAAGGLSS